MKSVACGNAAQFVRQTILSICCGILVASAANAQIGGSCAVSQVRVRIGTAAQNPLANNLDIEIHFTDGTIQTASDVNGSATDVNGTASWAINSQMVVTIPLKKIVSVTEIKRIRLIDHISAGEWDMSFLRAKAIGNGGLSMLVAEWGTDPNPSPHQFTPTYPAFSVYTKIPISPCVVAQMPVEGPIRVAPGTPVESRQRLTNEGIVQMVRQGEPETAIIRAIRANSEKFDVSLNTLLALHRKGVSGHVLNAMVIAELRQRNGLSGAGGTNAAELSPRPYPPKNGTLLTPSAQQTLLGTQANSPSGDGGKSSLLPAVQRPAVADGSVGDGSVRTGAPAGAAVQAGTLNGAGNTAAIANRTAVMAPAMMQQTSPGKIGASQPMSAQGNVSSSAMLTRPAGTVAATPQTTTAASSLRTANLTAMAMPSKVNLQVAEECAKDPTRRILSITSSADSSTSAQRLAIGIKPTPVIFRPGPQYTIWGCSLGSMSNPDIAQVYLSSGDHPCLPGGSWCFPFLLYLDIDHSDANEIVVSFPLDPTELEWLRQNGLGEFTSGFNLIVQDDNYHWFSLDGFGYSTYPQ